MTKLGMQRLALLTTAVVLLGAALTTAFVVRESMNEKKIARAREQGMALYRAGEDEYESALPYLGIVIANIKDDPEILIAYAECRAAVPLPNDAHFGRAIAAAKAAVAIEPENLKTQQILLRLYADSGYITELIDLSGKILERDPSLYDPRFDRIDALYTLGRISEALEESEILAQKHPNKLESHKVRAELAHSNGESLSAILAVAYQQRERFSDNPEYFAWLSSLELISGNSDAAIDLAQIAAGLPPVSAEQISTLIDLLRELDRETKQAVVFDDGQDEKRPLLELADSLFERALEDPKMGSAVAAEATRRAWWANQTDRAIEFAGRITEVKSDEEKPPYWWAAIALLSKPVLDNPAGASDPAQSGFETEEYNKSAGNSDWGTVIRALDTLQHGDVDEASRMLETFDPEDKEAKAVTDYIRGSALAQMGDTRGAILSLRDAAETGGIPRDRAWKTLGDVYTSIKDIQKAQSAYENMARLETVAIIERLDFILRVAEQEGEISIAKDAFDLIKEKSIELPDDLMLKVRLARAMILVGDVENGIQLARELVGQNPPPDAIGTLALVGTLRVYDPSLGDELLSMMTVRTDSIELLASRAMILWLDGKPDEARELLGSEISKREGDAALPYRRALLRVLDEFDTEDAAEIARGISDDFQDSATAQLGVLKSKAIWTDPEGARLAVSRLRETIGENSMVWRSYDARATLEAEPTGAELSEVILRLGDVLKESPDDFDALVLTARANKIIAERYMESDPDGDSGQYIDRASSYYDRAEGKRYRAAAFKPHINMLREFGRIAEAERALDRFAALEYTPKSKRNDLYKEQLIERIDLFVAAGRREEAAADQAWFASPDKPKSMLYLATLLQQAGNAPAASSIIEQFLEQGELTDVNLKSSAIILADVGYVDRSIEVYNMISEQSEVGDRDQLIANMLMRISRPAEALPLQLRIARERGGVADWVTAIRVATATQDQTLIEATIAEASAANPGAPEIRAFSNDNQLQLMMLVFASAVPNDASDDLLALRDLTSSLGRQEAGDDELVTSLAAFSDEHPALYDGWNLSVNLLFAMGQEDEAIATAERAAASMPDSPDATKLLVKALRSFGKLGEAVPVAERLVVMTRPTSYDAEVILAMIETDRGNYQRSIELLSPYRDRLDRESIDGPSDGLRTLAVAFAGIGNPAEARALFVDSVVNGSAEWGRVAILAAAALPNNEFEARREWLNLITVPSLAGPRANGLLRLARFSGERRDAQSAMALFEKFGSASSPDWLWVAAQAAILLGDSDKAEDFHREILALAPDEFGVLVSLADLLARQPGKAGEALAAISSLRSQADPARLSERRTIEIDETEARAYLAQGELAKAHQLLDPLLTDGVITDSGLILLSKTYLLEGNLDRATGLVEQVSESDRLDARTRIELQALRDAL